MNDSATKKRTKKTKDIYTPSIPLPPTPPPEPSESKEPEQPEVISEPSPALDLSAPSVPMSIYLQLYKEHMNLQSELLKAKREIINLQTQQMALLKPKKNNNAHELKEQLVDLILNSELNIEAIPDDIERQIYLTIINALDTATSKCCFF